MNVDQFRSAFRDLARPNRFKITLSRLGSNLSFFSKSSSIPANNVAAAQVHYQGRTVNIPGDRETVTWSIDVYGQNTFEIYNAAEDWMTAQNDPQGNFGGAPSDIWEDAYVDQLGRDDTVLRSWQLVGVFPTSIGQMALDWSTNNQVHTFTLNLAMQYVLPMNRSGVGGISSVLQ